MLLSLNLAPAMHHFGISGGEAIVFISAVLLFVIYQYFWPHDPDRFRKRMAQKRAAKSKWS